MKRIYAFMEDDDYVSNIYNVISPVGEMSEYSKTYSTDNRHYQLDKYPGLDLIVSKSTDEDTNTEVGLTNSEVETAMLVYNRVKAYCLANIQPFNLLNFKIYLYNQFPELLDFDVDTNIIQHTNISMPGYVSYNYNGNYYRIWLADIAFRNQYEFFTIKVIPPIANLDLFFTTSTTIKSELDKMTYQKLNDLIDQAKNNEPYTFIRFFDFDFIYPPNPNIRIPTRWIVLVHGLYGDYIDNIKDALINYILSHSEHNEAEWRIRFPEIFRRTEFSLVPFWHTMAIANMDLLSGVYRSMQNLQSNLSFVTEFLDYYPPNHVALNATVFPNDYKSIMITSVNGTANIEGKTSILNIFHDYIPVNTASLDFNRMRVFTKDWCIKLQKALMVAETATKDSIIGDTEVRRTFRNNKLFIAFTYDKINYLIAARSNQHFAIEG